MADKPIHRQYQRTTHLSPAVFLLVLIGITIKFSIFPHAAVAETSGQKPSASEVARELANPNSSLATLTLKNQYRWYTGDLPGAGDQDNYTMVFQPVFPLSLPKDGSGNAEDLFHSARLSAAFRSTRATGGERWSRLGRGIGAR